MTGMRANATTGSSMLSQWKSEVMHGCRAYLTQAYAADLHDLPTRKIPWELFIHFSSKVLQDLAVSSSLRASPHCRHFQTPKCQFF
jgi:hypothetical protein